MNLCKRSVSIMAILRSQKKTDYFHVMTIDEISEYERISKRITIYKKLKLLIDIGYVGTGLKDKKSTGYFLTESGAAFLPPVSNTKEDDE